MTSEEMKAILRSVSESLSSDEIVTKRLRLEAERSVDLLSAEVVREAAILLLIADARNNWRASNLKTELRAQKRVSSVGAELALKPKINQERNARIKAESDARVEKIENDFYDRLFSTVNEFAQSLKMEWTEDLLATGFALPDGSLTTWGDATVEQHDERRRMLTFNVQRNAEAAARHSLAIERIAQAGAQTLREAVSA